MMRLLLVLLSFVLVGCCYSELDVRSEPLFPSHLASSHVRTPDPLKACFVGEQLVIYWHLPRKYECDTLTLQIDARTRNGFVETKTVTLPGRKGWTFYRTIGDEYQEKGSLLTYKVTLLVGGTPRNVWRHHLWTDLFLELDQGCS